MDLRINLQSASLKDAEHAIFIIGAYFGMTNLPHVVNPAQLTTDAATLIRTGADVSVLPDGSAVVMPATAAAPPPNEPSAAQVFGGNTAGVAAVPAGPVLPATPAPSAPIAAAPVGTPPAPTPAPGASVELDAEGLPWDPRINALGDSDKHPKNADGKWRAKRGLNDGTLVAAVKAELRQTLAAGTFAPVVPVAPVAPAVPPASPTVPPAVVLPPVPPVAPSAPVGPPTTFEQLMPRITAAVLGGVLPKDAAPLAVAAYGLPNLPALSQRPDMVPTIWVYLQSMYPGLA